MWLAIKQPGRLLFAAVFQQVAERIGAGTLEHGAESYVVADTGSEAATIFFSKGPYERVAALPPDLAIGIAAAVVSARLIVLGHTLSFGQQSLKESKEDRSNQF